MNSYEKALAYLRYRIDNEYRTIIKPALGGGYTVIYSSSGELYFETFQELCQEFAESYDAEVEAGNIIPKEEYEPAKIEILFPVEIYSYNDMRELAEELARL